MDEGLQNLFNFLDEQEAKLRLISQEIELDKILCDNNIERL